MLIDGGEMRVDEKRDDTGRKKKQQRGMQCSLYERTAARENVCDAQHPRPNLLRASRAREERQSMSYQANVYPVPNAGRFGWLEAAIELNGDPTRTGLSFPFLTGGAGGARRVFTGGGGAARLVVEREDVDATELVGEDPGDADRAPSRGKVRTGVVGESTRISGGALRLPVWGSATSGEEGSRMRGGRVRESWVVKSAEKLVVVASTLNEPERMRCFPAAEDGAAVATRGRLVMLSPLNCRVAGTEPDSLRACDDSCSLVW